MTTRADEWPDISSNNALPDLAAYRAAGGVWLSRKVTEGTGYHWFDGDDLADEWHRRGGFVEHYAWLREDQDAAAQADYLLECLGAHLKPGDRIMTDCEQTYGLPVAPDAHRAAQLRTFNTRVVNKLRTVELRAYVPGWYLDGKPLLQAEARRWDNVASDYSGVATLPNPYGMHFVAWQFTDHATVPGFPSPVDYNRALVADPSTTVSEGITSMYSLLRDAKTGHWYRIAPGTAVPVKNITSPGRIKLLARDPLCVNGDAIHAVLHAQSVGKPLRPKALSAAQAQYTREHAVLEAIIVNAKELSK